MDPKDAILRAREKKIVIPAFNVAHLPMMKPIVDAVASENSVAMVQVARVEWEKMNAGTIEETAKEYQLHGNSAHTMLHLDHIPAIDEDGISVDYMPYFERAIAVGFQSVMIDGSRLDLEGNIKVTAEVTEMAHKAGVPCEAELGAVMGHESGPLPPYEEIFASKMGFTSIDEAIKFVKETGVDWLSVAIGNIHGAIAEASRSEKKPEARLDIDHVAALYQETKIPLVLHGGSGINVECIRDAVLAGIAKINVGTEIRQSYDTAFESSQGNIEKAQEAVYDKVREIISDSLRITNSKDLLFG